MPNASFPSVEGIDAEDSIEGSRVSSLDETDTLIGSDVDEVKPLIPHDEEVVSPFYGRYESLYSIPINFKESRLDVDGNDVEHFSTNKEEVESETSYFLDDDEE